MHNAIDQTYSKSVGETLHTSSDMSSRNPHQTTAPNRATNRHQLAARRYSTTQMGCMDIPRLHRYTTTRQWGLEHSYNSNGTIDSPVCSTAHGIDKYSQGDHSTSWRDPKTGCPRTRFLGRRTSIGGPLTRRPVPRHMSTRFLPQHRAPCGQMLHAGSPIEYVPMLTQNANASRSSLTAQYGLQLVRSGIPSGQAHSQH